MHSYHSKDVETSAHWFIKEQTLLSLAWHWFHTWVLTCTMFILCNTDYIYYLVHILRSRDKILFASVNNANQKRFFFDFNGHAHKPPAKPVRFFLSSPDMLLIPSVCGIVGVFSCLSLTGTSLMIKYDEKCRNSQQHWCSNFLLTVQTEYMYVFCLNSSYKWLPNPCTQGW